MSSLCVGSSNNIVYLVNIGIEWTATDLEETLLLEQMTRGQVRQSDVAREGLGEQLIDKLINMQNANVSIGLESETTIVGEQWLEVAVNVDRLRGEAKIERAQCAHVFELALLNISNSNFLLGGDLQHFQRQADERGRATRAAKGAADFAQTSRFVEQSGGGQCETMFFPIH